MGRTVGHDYRIGDRQVWTAWLERIAGHPAAEVEVHKRTLRVKDDGLAAQASNLFEISFRQTLKSFPSS